MPSIILTVLHTLQAAFSAYNLYLASISISNLQGYEETSKKAARYSNTAAQQLHKTRTTQASGTISVLFTFLSSSLLVIYPVFTEKLPAFTELLLTVANAAALLSARAHVGGFWKGKAKVPLPGVGDYNEVISKTQEVRLNMAYMAASWVVCGGLLMFLSLGRG